MEIRKRTRSSAVHLLQVREKENQVKGEIAHVGPGHQPPAPSLYQGRQRPHHSTQGRDQIPAPATDPTPTADSSRTHIARALPFTLCSSRTTPWSRWASGIRALWAMCASRGGRKSTVSLLGETWLRHHPSLNLLVSRACPHRRGPFLPQDETARSRLPNPLVLPHPPGSSGIDNPLSCQAARPCCP